MKKFISLTVMIVFLFSTLTAPFVQAVKGTWDLRDASRLTGDMEHSEAVREFWGEVKGKVSSKQFTSLRKETGLNIKKIKKEVSEPKRKRKYFSSLKQISKSLAPKLRIFAAFHRGPLLRLLENFLSHPRLKLEEEDQQGASKRFIKILTKALSKKIGSRNTKDVDIQELLSTQNLKHINEIDSTLLTRFLGEGLSRLLRSRKARDLSDAEQKLVERIEKEFNLSVEYFGFADEIKSVEVVAHEENDLVEDAQTFILSPLVGFGKKLVYFPHREILKRLLKLEEEDRRFMINLLIEYEFHYYFMLDRGIDFDAAQDLLQNTEVYLPLNEFGDSVVHEILFPSSIFRLPTLDGFTLLRVEELLKDESYLAALSQSASTHAGWPLEKLRVGVNSLKFYFEGGRFISLVADEERHFWRLRVWGQESEEDHLNSVAENLAKLLTLEAHLKVIQMKQQLVQNRGRFDSALLKRPILSPLKNLRSLGISSAFLAEIFQYEYSPYALKMDLFDGSREVQYDIFHASLPVNWNFIEALVGKIPKLSTTIIAERNITPGHEADFEEKIKEILFKRALQSGLLRLIFNEDIGFTEIKSLHHSPLHIGDIDQMEKILEQEFSSQRVLLDDEVERALAEGVAVVAERSLVELGYPSTNASVVIEGVDKFNQFFTNSFVKNHLKVVAIGIREGVFLKQTGLSDFDLSTIFSYSRHIFDRSMPFGNDVRFDYGAERFGKNKNIALGVPCDVLVLAGGGGVLRVNNHRLEDQYGNEVRVQAKVIVEAVEGAITPEAREFLKKKAKNTVIVPAILATLGETLLAKRKSLGGDFAQPIRRAVQWVFSSWADPQLNKKNRFFLQDTLYLLAVCGMLETRLEMDIGFVESVLEKSRWEEHIGAQTPPLQYVPVNFVEWIHFLGVVGHKEALKNIESFMRDGRVKGGESLNQYLNYRFALSGVFNHFETLKAYGMKKEFLAYWDLLVSMHGRSREQLNLNRDLNDLEIQMVLLLDKVRLEREFSGKNIQQIAKGTLSFMVALFLSTALTACSIEGSSLILPDSKILSVTVILFAALGVVKKIQEWRKRSVALKENMELNEQIKTILSRYFSLDQALQETVGKDSSQVVANFIDLLVIGKTLSKFLREKPNARLLLVSDPAFIKDEVILTQLKLLGCDPLRVQIIHLSLQGNKFNLGKLLRHKEFRLEEQTVLLKTLVNGQEFWENTQGVLEILFEVESASLGRWLQSFFLDHSKISSTASLDEDLKVIRIVRQQQ